MAGGDDVTTGGADSGTGTAPATATPAPVAPSQPGGMPQTVSTLPATAPQIPNESVPELDDLSARHLPYTSFGSKLYHGVLNALGGSHDVTFERDVNTGKMVAHTADSSPGTQWKRIIAGALTGFAGAQAAGTRGPGGTLRGFAGGIQAGSNAVEQNRQQARGEADENYKAQLENATNNLRNSMLAQQVAQLSFQNTRAEVTAGQEDIDRLNTFNQLMDDGGQGTQRLGTFDTPQDVYKFAADYKDVMGHHVNGRVAIMPNVVDGKIKGFTAAIVTPDWQNSRTTRDYKIPTQEVKDGKVVDSEMTIPAGEKNGAVAQMLMAYAKERGQAKLQAAQTAHAGAETEDIPKAAKDRHTEAAASMMHAQTEQSESTSKIALDNAEAAAANAKAAATKAGVEDVDFGPGGPKGFNTWHKEMVEPALATEQMFQQSNKVYNEYQALRKQGKTFPTGAQSVQFLANHVAGTFGTVKGARIGRDIIEKHLGARGLSDNLVTGIQNIISGQQLSDGQWNAFFQMMNDRRDANWQTVLNDAKAEGRPTQLIAFPDDFRIKNGIASRVPSAENVLQQGTQPQAGAGAPVKMTPGEPTALAADGKTTLVVRSGQWVPAQQ